MLYADIIIDISHEKLDKTFQYIIPADQEEKIQIGMQVIIPFGNGSRRIKGYVVDITSQPKIDPARLKEVLGVARDSIAIESQLIALAAWMKRNYGSTMNHALKTVIPIKQKTGIKEKKMVTLTLDDKQARIELNALLARKNHSQGKERLLRELMEHGTIEWNMITGKLNVASSIIRDFEKNAWITVTSSRDYRNPVKEVEAKAYALTLNQEQQQAVDTVMADYLRNIYKTYLIHGVTGSGKTEVYMELISHVIDQGREAIVLIPEIALTYQTVMRFYGRFGNQVSIINSRLSPGERYDQFERAKKGDIKIMIGPRSALFTPFSNLGLIIIDEEHEATYKSETVPKYHARETAIQRAKMANASVVLGSATPSIESYQRAMKGEYQLIELKQRVEAKPLPECEVVDLREELKSGNRSILSGRLSTLMEDRLRKGQQTMLFINRRGLLGFVSCRACGHVIKCPHCDVSLSLHNNGRLQCHYCGYTTAKPKVCPQCGSKFIGGFKAGTQMIEEVVKKQFPTARVLRMDMDTTKGKNGHQEILSAFSNREADILVGTQMIVKGHDFPMVTLVGVLAADLSLNANDYRAGERTFQLLTQAAGRAGRGKLPGAVVIQTYQPDNYSIVAASKQDYESFYQQEIAYRELLDYPPAAHMLVIQITSMSEPAALERGKQIAALIQKAAPHVLFTGPTEATIARVNDVYKKVIYVRHPQYQQLIDIKDVIEEYLLNTKELSNVSVWFDFDPMNGF